VPVYAVIDIVYEDFPGFFGCYHVKCKYTLKFEGGKMSKNVEREKGERS
jgi:hypothetical protein